mmetsp:Transcript_14880/g.35918  ORF Transcript_14880/g.35918 Transcript_14880/m.35918 type:complete len:409 (-) Transcript_14880:426-1652(-)
MQPPRRAQEAARGPGVLPRLCAGAQEVRTPGLEHPVRVQRPGSEDLPAAAAHVPQRGAPRPGRRGAAQGAGVPGGRVQLRRARDGRQGPAADEQPAVQLHRRGGGVRDVQLLALRRVRQPQLQHPGGLRGVHQDAAAGAGAGDLRAARERGHHVRPERDVRHVRDGAVAAAARQQRRRPQPRGRHRGVRQGHLRALPAPLRHRPGAPPVPHRLQPEHEYGADAGVHPLQRPDHRHAQEPAGEPEGAQGPGGDVARAGGSHQQHLRQPGARHVGQQGVPEPEAAVVLGHRPAGAHQVHQPVDRQGPAPGVLDQRPVLPAGVPHGHSAELRAQVPDRHRHRHVELQRGGQEDLCEPEDAARGRVLRVGVLSGGRAVGLREAPAGGVQAQGAVHGLPHDVAGAQAAPRGAH